MKLTLELFPDLFDAIEKAFKALKAIASLPQKTRDELRNMFDETFKLLDTSLNMITIRLGQILKIQKDKDFIAEVKLLNNEPSWTNAEREFRLCRSLRNTVDEASRLGNKIRRLISVKDWNDMQNQMEVILQGEERLGDFIAGKFRALSTMVKDQGGTVQQKRDALMQFQDTLNAERRRLIKMEINLSKSF